MTLNEYTGRCRIRLFHGDCMEAMRLMDDGQYGLAVVDPPYGVNISGVKFGKWGASKLELKEWDNAIPTSEYFKRLKSVAKNQIIFGANYFNDVWPCRGFFVWDKGNGFKNRTYAECEIAATSFDLNAKIFMYDPLANRDYHGKIHVTQKPVPIYHWLLANYAKPGDTILDTHGGSMSIALACWEAGHDLDLYELDADYYRAGVERFERFQSQGLLF